jgi:hypothetical protein
VCWVAGFVCGGVGAQGTGKLNLPTSVWVVGGVGVGVGESQDGGSFGGGRWLKGDGLGVARGFVLR